MEITPLNAELPYPPIDSIKPDAEAARIIAPLYASGETFGEAAAFFQYLYHCLIFDEYKMQKQARSMENIAMAELIHMQILGKTLIKLGIDPVYTAKPPIRSGFFNTSRISTAKAPQKMLMDDIAAETQAINNYNQALKRLRNEEAAAVIQRIILDEKLHLEELKELLSQLT